MTSTTTTFKLLREYFENLATQHLLLDGNFVYGGSSDIQQSTVSDKAFPLLWLETPFVEINDSGSSFSATKRSAFVILAKVDTINKTKPQQYEVMDQLEEIALDILSKLKKDARENLHKIELSGTIEPVDPLLIDNCIGVRFEFEMTNVFTITYNSENWN
jgi:hypothetical protein